MPNHLGLSHQYQSGDWTPLVSLAAITSNRPFRSSIPASGRYERSKRTFGDGVSSFDAYVTARIEESEYLFKREEPVRIEVAWFITGAFVMKLWPSATTDLGLLAEQEEHLVCR